MTSFWACIVWTSVLVRLGKNRLDNRNVAKWVKYVNFSLEAIFEQIPAGVLSMFLILYTTTDCAQMKIFSLKALQPGCAAIDIPKTGPNQNRTPLSMKKNFCYPKFL